MPAPRWTTLYTSPLMTIGDYRCRPDCTGTGPEEAAASPSMALLRSGSFARHLGRRLHVADPNWAVFFNPGVGYRVSHPAGGGDNCTVFQPSGALLAEALGRADPAALDRGVPGFSWEHAPTRPRVHLAHRLLFATVTRRAEGLEVEEVACRVFAETLAGAVEAGGGGPARPDRRSPATRAAHEDLAEAAKVQLTRCMREGVTLGAVAVAVHASPFHLARVFASVTGATMHRYLDRLRLRAVLDRLADPKADLSRVALDVGYCDQSHLSNAFRREFGLTPSAWRAAAGRGEAVSMSKILQDRSGGRL